MRTDLEVHVWKHYSDGVDSIVVFSFVSVSDSTDSLKFWEPIIDQVRDVNFTILIERAVQLGRVATKYEYIFENLLMIVQVEVPIHLLVILPSSEVSLPCRLTLFLSHRVHSINLT